MDDKLKKHWDNAVAFGYNEDKILGVFEEDSGEINIVIIPSLKELCIRQYVDLSFIKSEGKNIRIVDISFIAKPSFRDDILYTENYIINPRYESLFNDYFLDSKNIEDGILEISKFSFIELKKTVSKEIFLRQLSNIESMAYDSIIREVGDEGNVIISRIVEKYGISRFFYNNLFNKMREYKVATVVATQNKGTHIKIIEPELKREAARFK